MKKFNIKIFFYILTGLIMLNSCLNSDIEEAVEYKDYYNTLDDADNAIKGLYGQFMELAEQVVVLNELRGEYLDVTENASLDLIEINNHQPDKANPWISVQKFYGVIQNCNDILYNFDLMLKENKLTTEEHKERYSDVGALRTWLYYQLGVHFGEVPYIVDPVVDISDIDKYKGNVLNLDQLIPTLISFMENLPTLEPYLNSQLIANTLDGYSLVPFFINKKCLLGDLYLFNNEYEKAATIYRDVLSEGEDLAATDRRQHRKNRLYSWVWTGGEVDYFAVLYSRYKQQDLSTLYNAWRGMFSLPADNQGVREEMIWEMTFDYKFAPKYPFIELFSNQGKGKYLLKPSDYAISDLWGAQVQNNGFPYDCRGISGGVEEQADGTYLVAKYSYDYDAINKPFQQSGKWFLYRAAILNLRYAEAANRAGYPRLAWALVNDGIKGEAFRWRHEDGSEYRGDSIAQSSWGPGNNYPEPYYFDARNSEQPYLRSPWRDGAGVRGRVNLPNIDMSHITTHQDSIAFVEKMILNEAGLELAFEGHRWTDLIRYARRYQKENGSGGSFLNETLRGKYLKAGQPAPDLSAERSWYFTLPNE
ncbi:MAG: RagB/SusD family nutrient uptake outer membrane protein [Porphyromonadaceae bacterium]|nr:RagB/SusD family nutrient uptake outer membrane protein [Porphyromonadaceae bacterium]